MEAESRQRPYLHWLQVLVLLAKPAPTMEQERRRMMYYRWMQQLLARRSFQSLHWYAAANRMARMRLNYSYPLLHWSLWSSEY
jgi:hypothetical protein